MSREQRLTRQFISTAMTKSLSLLHPVVLAPMGGVSGSRLAVAVADAGGLGFIGSTGEYKKHQHLSFLPTRDLVSEFYDAIYQTQNAHRLGVGLSIQSELNGDPFALGEVILKTRPRNVWLSFGDFGPHMELLKSNSSINIFLQVSSFEDVKTAYGYGAHAIVLKGNGSGGYFDSSYLPYLNDLIPFARNFVNKMSLQDSPQYNPLLIAAGGIMTGEHVAQCLKLGADGVCLGTRLAATIESDLSDEEKIRLVTAARGKQIIREDPDGRRLYSGSGVEYISGVKTAAEEIENIMTDASKIYTSETRHI